MGVKAKFNNKEYELIYNSQSGFYEIKKYKFGQKKKKLMYKKKH